MNNKISCITTALVLGVLSLCSIPATASDRYEKVDSESSKDTPMTWHKVDDSQQITRTPIGATPKMEESDEVLLLDLADGDSCFKKIEIRKEGKKGKEKKEKTTVFMCPLKGCNRESQIHRYGETHLIKPASMKLILTHLANDHQLKINCLNTYYQAQTYQFKRTKATRHHLEDKPGESNAN